MIATVNRESINHLMFVMVNCGVSFELQAEFLNII
jgi:hypothetical protein